MTTPGQTFQLRNESFCSCTSCVDVVLSIHTLHAMHMHVPHAMHVLCSAQVFGDRGTQLATVRGFCYSSIPCRRVSSKLWGQMWLGVLMCMLRGHLPHGNHWIWDQKVAEGLSSPRGHGCNMGSPHQAMKWIASKTGFIQGSPLAECEAPMEGHAWVQTSFRSRW